MLPPRIIFLLVYLTGFFVVSELLNPLIWNMMDLVYPAPSTQFCAAFQPDCPADQVPNEFWYLWFLQKFVIVLTALAIYKGFIGMKKK